MPLYEYECDACGHCFEAMRKFADVPLETCPACGKGPVRKLISAPAIQFKGAGWYVTDYAKKDASSPATGETGEKGEKKDTQTTADKPAAGRDSPASSAPAATTTPASAKSAKKE